MQIQRLSNDAIEVEILPEVGGRLHRIRAYGHDLLRTPPDPQMHVSNPFFWGCFPLVPWSNRVPGGRIVFRGRVVQVPCNFGDTAIHGEAYARPWQVDGEGQLSFRGGQFAFPWPYEARQQHAIDGSRWTLSLTVTNTGAAEMPAGLGIHPWFAAGAGLEAAFPADLTYPLVNNIPSGPPVPVSGPLDRRTLSPFPWGLDNIWTGLTAHQIQMRRPDITLDSTFAFTQSATHITAASVEQNDAVAIEPVTHATDGFRLLAEGLPGAIGVLQPGETLGVTYTLDIRLR
ncbi:MAG: aldose 1-epimerase [Dehalococcoidia bacterium]